MELTPSGYVDTFARDNLPPADLWPDLEFTIDDVNYPDRLNAATTLIDDAVARFGPERLALFTPEGEEWTYGELLARSNQIARVITEDCGIVPGNRVLLRAPNTPWIIAAWLGVLKAGGVVVTTMAMLREKEVDSLLELTQPNLALVDHRFLDGFSGPAASRGVEIIPIGSDADNDLTVRSGQKAESFDNVVTAADDVALLCPTSGTTGAPKATMHFHRDILANADTFARHIVKVGPDDKCACSAPLAFTFGLGALVVFPLYFGAASLVVERATPLELAQYAHDSGVTILYTAPTAYRAIIKAGRADLLSDLRLGVSAGEHLPQATWEAVHEATGLKLIDGIGGTEMLHVFISAAGDDIKPGAVGKPVPGFRAVILDDDGNEAPDNTVGRLAVRGPLGCRYLNDERQRNYVVNGWNVTGDAFLRDDDGYFVYQARSDNMIISSGYNIGAPEVEIALNEHPDVVECAVVGKDDRERGALVTAFVVLREDAAEGKEKAREIQNFVKTQIAPYKYPREIRFVEALPRNPSGKLQHFKLRDALKAEAAPAVHA
ncbi:2-aminobenzoate-CoA ligase [Brevibacterium sp. 239c]|uniref:AMP-binding protein n=1 Tax=Brevibacterium sp. 239c TaxID=1965356 RepID=UPI000C697ED5|nr:AMP-binding protein [Brevibacterium sp. 239c]SMY04219.1 2-aminobenzoate-CoA ligase [Brevibacterium sp. 239c]